MSTVTFIHPSAELYGSDRMAIETVRALKRAGYSVRVVLPGRGPLESEIGPACDSINIIDVPVIRKADLHSLRNLASALARNFTASIKAYRWLKKQRTSVVYINTIVQPSWIVASGISRTPTICHVREAEPDQNIVIRTLLNLPLVFCKRIIANSKTTQASVSTAVPWISSRTEVVLNGKDWSTYYSLPPRVNLSEPVQVALIGRLSPRKGQDTAIAAVADLKNDGYNVKLSLIGSEFPGYEWYVESLQSLVARNDLQDRVVFRGFISDVGEEVASSDIVLVPSRIEPFGTVALEAFAALRPVIASRLQGLAEIITDGHDGLLVRPDDYVDLAQAIRRLIDRPGLRIALAENGYRTVHAHYTTEAYAKQITSNVRDTLNPAVARNGRTR